MFDHDSSGPDRPIAFCLHYLGGSAREWARVAERLAPAIEIVAIDLPGFGDARDCDGYTVAEMVAFVARAIEARAPHRWILVGHSMGAKVATVLASEIERGARMLPGLAGVVTVAGSPPSPEPMAATQREKMLGWFASGADTSDAQAHEFVRSNSERLDERSTELAVSDVLRTNRAAWIAWLEHGSREDWSERVGVLQTSGVVIAGADDPELGPGAQRRFMLPHFASAHLLTLPNAKHLLPLERASDIARAIALAVSTARYRELTESTRVSTQTRVALTSRETPPGSAYEPMALDRTTFETLRVVVDRVVPQSGFPAIDLAAKIDEQLHAAQGDGWRFAALPPDARAYRDALATLDDVARGRGASAFVALDAKTQDEVLHGIAAAGSDARVPAAEGRLTGDQMRLWFEDLRVDAVKAFALHPQTLARMGYGGIANGGDGEPKSGFARVGLGEREAWEPVAFGDVRA